MLVRSSRVHVTLFLFVCMYLYNYVQKKIEKTFDLFIVF